MIAQARALNLNSQSRYQNLLQLLFLSWTLRDYQASQPGHLPFQENLVTAKPDSFYPKPHSCVENPFTRHVIWGFRRIAKRFVGRIYRVGCPTYRFRTSSKL